MKCRQWKIIQNELDIHSGISPRMQAHLDTCPDCRGRLNDYTRFIRLFRNEAEDPKLVNTVRSLRRKPSTRARLIAAAVLFSMCAAVPVAVLSVRSYAATALRRGYAEDISREIMKGGLFSEVSEHLPVYEGTWFEAETGFGPSGESAEIQ
jgi:predicted anti-sigma-YlaC factor YlaD